MRLVLRGPLVPGLSCARLPQQKRKMSCFLTRFDRAFTRTLPRRDCFLQHGWTHTLLVHAVRNHAAYGDWERRPQKQAVRLETASLTLRNKERGNGAENGLSSIPRGNGKAVECRVSAESVQEQVRSERDKHSLSEGRAKLTFKRDAYLEDHTTIARENFHTQYRHSRFTVTFIVRWERLRGW